MKKLILDLDTGVDDALAISYALGSPEVELIGITGTYGNVLVEQGVRNALAVTDLLGHPEVKVYQGLSHSSTTDHFEVLPVSAFIHGDNGIGDVDIPDSNRSVETELAVDFIIDAVKTYGKDLIYVPTGPMTNIEAALKKAPEIKDEIGQIVLMGGALTVPGNCNACMEANISQDPEAADYLFRSGTPTTMIGLDVTLQTLLTYKETQQWRDLGTKAGKFLADMTDFYIKAYETTSPHLGGCGLHDPLAVGVAVDPTLVTTLDINMKVDVDGPTRGRTIGDETRLNDPVKTMCHEAGVKVLLNDSPFTPSLPAELIEASDILLVNEHEMAQLLGIDEPENDDWDSFDWWHALDELRGFGFEQAIVTLGGDGSVVLDGTADDPEHRVQRIAPVRVKAVDTTGCGDSFMGTVLAGLASGLALSESAELASYVSAYAATGYGAQASYGNAAQIREAFASAE